MSSCYSVPNCTRVFIGIARITIIKFQMWVMIGSFEKIEHEWNYYVGILLLNHLNHNYNTGFERKFDFLAFTDTLFFLRPLPWSIIVHSFKILMNFGFLFKFFFLRVPLVRCVLFGNKHNSWSSLLWSAPWRVSRSSPSGNQHSLKQLLWYQFNVQQMRELY